MKKIWSAVAIWIIVISITTVHINALAYDFLPYEQSEESAFTWEEVTCDKDQNPVAQLFEKNIDEKSLARLKGGLEIDGIDGYDISNELYRYISFPGNTIFVEIFLQWNYEEIAAKTIDELLANDMDETAEYYEALCDFDFERTGWRQWKNTELLTYVGNLDNSNGPLRIQIRPHGEFILGSEFPLGVVNDIKSMLFGKSCDMVFMGEKCTVSDIYFFNIGNHTIYPEYAIYFSTEKGVFVRYYLATNPGITFTQEQFQHYMSCYVEYRKYDAYGKSFFEYLLSEYDSQDSISSYPDYDFSKVDENDDNNVEMSGAWLAVCGIGGIAIGGTATYLLMRIPRKKPKE